MSPLGTDHHTQRIILVCGTDMLCLSTANIPTPTLRLNGIGPFTEPKEPRRSTPVLFSVPYAERPLELAISDTLIKKSPMKKRTAALQSTTGYGGVSESRDYLASTRLANHHIVRTSAACSSGDTGTTCHHQTQPRLIKVHRTARCNLMQQSPAAAMRHKEVKLVMTVIY